MANTSATGGYLLPAVVPLDDEGLQDFMHDVIVGVTGLPDQLVRPAFQSNPLKRPAIEVNWCAFYIGVQRSEKGMPYSRMNDEGSGTSVQRHQEFDMRCSFYGPNSAAYAGAFKDNLEINQNREQLFLAGMAYAYSGDIITLGDLVDEQWYQRSDVTGTFRRETNRDYSVLSFLAARGVIATEILTIDWAAGPEV